jgi:metal-responsive CopG/Arc/MetJ family transcriptional regulator
MKKRIIFRLPDGMYDQLCKAVKEDKGMTASALARRALAEYLHRKMGRSYW